MSKAFLLSVLLTGAIAPAPVGAQTPPRSHSAEAEETGPSALTPLQGGSTLTSRLDRNKIHCTAADDGTLWVRGRTYKASFSPDAAAYIPFLGSSAPRNFPVAMRVESVTISGAPIAFDAQACAVRIGDAIEYDRGAFRERYLLASDSVEQTFVFETLPARGEIVVTIAVDTELAHGEDADGLRFENELGHVRYGRAFAFDATGAKVPVVSRLAQGRIEIVAPEALVASARGAFVIDPVLSTYTVEASILDELVPDTAWDLGASTWVTVCEEIWSAADHDIHAVRHTTGGTITGDVYVNSSPEDWREPAIANNNQANEFFVVAAVGAAPGREIKGHYLTSSLPMAMSFPVSAVSNPALAGDKHSPDVGGDFSPGGTNGWLVVWEVELTPNVRHDIHAQLITNAGGPGTLYQIAGSTGEIHRAPAVSNSNGKIHAGERWWNIVYEHELTPTNRNIHARRLSHLGNLSPTPFVIASTSLDERAPSVTAEADVTGSVIPWLVAWQTNSSTNGWDIRCKPVDGTTPLSQLSLSAAFPGVGFDQLRPSCDTYGGQFVVAWEELVFPVYSDIRVATLWTVGGSLGLNEGEFTASPPLEIHRYPKVVTQASSGSTGDDALVVFEGPGADPHEVYATGYDMPNGGPVSSFCAGDGTGTACPCGNNGATGYGCASSVNASGAVLAYVGNARTSNDSFQLRADWLPASASVLFFQGTAPMASGAGAPFGDGLRCAAGTIRRLAFRTASAGFVVYPSSINDPDISVAGAVPAIGGRRYYQVWYRNAAAFCTASTFNLTNGLDVQWIQ